MGPDQYTRQSPYCGAAFGDLGLTAMDGETQRVAATGHDKRSSSAKETTREPKRAEVEAEFLVVENASDPFLIGYQTCADWGLAIESDASGIWVNFKKLGVRLLSEADPTAPKAAH